MLHLSIKFLLIFKSVKVFTHLIRLISKNNYLTCGFQGKKKAALNTYRSCNEYRIVVTAVQRRLIRIFFPIHFE